jgi:PadR family transcriptional regulator, regulatory protein PadR
MNRGEQELPRLSSKEKAILELLAARGRMYGLQLVSDAQGKLKRGTVYVTLSRMEQKGLVESEPEKFSDDSGLVPRRMYRATSFGVRVLEIWTRMAHELVYEVSR